ncbi:GvpL/GvpF family gas vesicle protein [Streptomyces sp. NPDC047117]|uniref:GvpL/GvpF family gas vesicle protein n=1 Tax=Streptomyces sp. NPDC047117 TaxID=3155379 RepID=UPI0033C9E844
MTARPNADPPHAEPPHAPVDGPLYAHAIVRRGFRPRPGLAGADGGTVIVVPEGPLAALVSVPRGPGGVWGGDGFPRASGAAGMSPAEAAQDAADAHRRVVDEAAATVCVLPLRIGTVHHGEAQVRRVLTERADLYERLLTRLDGRLEWGVKAYADDAAGAWAAGDGDGAALADGAGEPVDKLARAAHHALADVAECSRVHHRWDACPHGVLPGAAASCATSAYWTSPISGAPYPHGRNLLDSAYLVHREAAGVFAETVGGLVARCPELHIELTGPWAPYSFADPDELPDLWD